MLNRQRLRKLEAIPRPVVTMATDYPAGERIPEHHHRRAQLIHAAAGVMTVLTRAGRYVIPPGRALWVPAGMPHAIRIVSRLAMRTLYVRPGAHPGLPAECTVVDVPPLLRELILTAMILPPLYDEQGPDGRLIEVLLDRLAVLPVAPLHLPMPADRRLRRITEALSAEPGDERPLSAWAEQAGASTATLERRFRAETGMSFGTWRQQLRLVVALERLALGQPVTRVALELGYASVSAFIAMFRRSLGTTPGRYFQAERVELSSS